MAMILTSRPSYTLNSFFKIISFCLSFYNLFQLKIKYKGHRLNTGSSNIINITA